MKKLLLIFLLVTGFANAQWEPGNLSLQTGQYQSILNTDLYLGVSTGLYSGIPFYAVNAEGDTSKYEALYDMRSGLYKTVTNKDTMLGVPPRKIQAQNIYIMNLDELLGSYPTLAQTDVRYLFKSDSTQIVRLRDSVSLFPTKVFVANTYQPIGSYATVTQLSTKKDISDSTTFTGYTTRAQLNTTLLSYALVSGNFSVSNLDTTITGKLAKQNTWTNNNLFQGNAGFGTTTLSLISKLGIGVTDTTIAWSVVRTDKNQDRGTISKMLDSSVVAWYSTLGGNFQFIQKSNTGTTLTSIDSVGTIMTNSYYIVGGTTNGSTIRNVTSGRIGIYDLSGGAIASLVLSSVYLGSRGIISAPTDGVLQYTNAATTDATRFVIGLNTTSGVAIGKSGTTMSALLGDGSALTGFISLYERFGTGSPEGVVTAPVGAQYIRTDGTAGTLRYSKETGTGNTGWVAKW